MFAGATWSTLPLMHRIRARTLIIAGDADPLLPPINARVMAWRIPNAQLRVIDGGGHLVVVDSADEVAPIINGFLHGPVGSPGRASTRSQPSGG